MGEYAMTPLAAALLETEGLSQADEIVEGKVVQVAGPKSRKQFPRTHELKVVVGGDRQKLCESRAT